MLVIQWFIETVYENIFEGLKFLNHNDRILQLFKDF